VLTLRDVRAALNELHGRDKSGEMNRTLRQMDPFALDRESHRPVPFLLIEDPQLSDDESRKDSGPVDRHAWKGGPHTRERIGPVEVHMGGEPLVIYTSNLRADAREMLPQACIFDSQDKPEQPAYIWWNCLKDLTASKFNHISNQAFYLRRYARRVASLWEKEYGRRPAVHASTAVSLNGRPFQQLVDPDADLASVPVAWFRHNPWIRDLETPRIPREALAGTPAD